MKRTAWRIYNIFRGPVGLSGPMGLDGQPGKPGTIPMEWEHRLRRLEEESRATAWDDGYLAGYRDRRRERDFDLGDNPYRADDRAAD